jgi:hypothetical protein
MRRACTYDFSLRARGKARHLFLQCMLVFLSWLQRLNISETLEDNIFFNVSSTPYDSEAHLDRCRHARPETLLIFYVLIEQSFTHCQTKLAEG